MWFVSDAIDAVPEEHQDGASDVLPVAPVKLSRGALPPPVSAFDIFCRKRDNSSVLAA